LRIFSGNRFSLREKIILPYLFLALLLAIGAAFIGTRVVFDSIEERFINQLIEAGKLSSEWMVKEESRLLETQRLLAYAEGIPESVQAEDAEKLRTLAYPIAVNSGEEAVEILNPQGTTLLSMHHRDGGNVEDYEFSRGDETFKQLDFVQKILTGQVDALGDKYTAVVQTRWGQYFYVAGPIDDDKGKLVGVVLVGKSLNTLVRQIREATLAQVTLYTLEGQPMATTLLQAQPLNADTAANTLTQKDSQSFERDLISSDIDHVEIVGAWQVRHGSNLGLMGVAFAKNFLILVNQNTWVQVLFSILIALLLVAAVGYFVSNRISGPILKLEQATSQVAQGDLKVQVPSIGDDEVAKLADRFNRMVVSLDRSKTELVAAYDTTLEGWVRVLDLRDRETTGHSQRVVDLTIRLAQRMNVPETQLEHIRRGALLHDIGKMAVPDEILRKPGSLTDAEWEIMRQHPTHAAQMISGISFLEPAADIPGLHHEKWDGTGYPRGLKGEEIPIAARIFAVIDTWDAVLSDRPYRKARTETEARKILEEGRGTQFDPQVVDEFLVMVDGPWDLGNPE
jgi:putative nucleotidyltransferase with HDIG domain